jgi:SM-20-related protein
MDPELTTTIKAPDAPAAAALTDRTLRRLAPDVAVIDGLLDQGQRAFVRNALRRPWAFGWKSSAKTDEYSFWHQHFAGHRSGAKDKPYECSDELGKNAPALFAFWRWLQRMEFFRGHELLRCYANGACFGGEGTIHTDAKAAGHYTAIYYPAEKWEPNWGGETLLFNEARDDIVAAVYPRPNRLLVFPGNMPHVARGVSRTCPELRVTLMFKTRIGKHDRVEADTVSDRASEGGQDPPQQAQPV